MFNDNVSLQWRACKGFREYENDTLFMHLLRGQ